MTQHFSDILAGNRTAAFLGEAGSGKTEIALNFAMGLRKETDRRIHFFDMDQTKPLFRARDAAQRLRDNGIEFHSNMDTSIEDVAAIAPGVLAAFAEEDSYIIMDVGGNEGGARVLGQFFEQLNRKDSMILLPINPYRPWFGNAEDLAVTIDKITNAARTQCVKVVSNPNFCAQTCAEDVLNGNERLKEMLGGKYEISFVCALEALCDELEDKLDERLIPIEIQILYPWME